MSGYIGREPLTPAVQRRQSFIATASQTDFSFMYQAGYLDVFLNGVKMRETEDYTATDNATVVFNIGLTVSDEVDLVSLNNFAAIDAYSQSEADTLLDGKSDTHTHPYEPADSTILKDSDIGSTVLSPTGDGSTLTGIDALPSQSGSTGKFLTTDGSDASWDTVDTATDFNSLTDTTVSTSDPAIDSNPSATGHLWVNKTSGETYVCTDATTGANVWTNIGEGVDSIAPFISATGGSGSESDGSEIDGDYKYHIFTSSGTFTVTATGAGEVEYLVLGGGGSGNNGWINSGSSTGGGGGAGGYLTSSGFSVSVQAYSVTVGGGGAWTFVENASASGSNSTFSSISSTGGGGGGKQSRSGANGGSGGGGGGVAGTANGGSGISGQGNAGGNGTASGAGGGGGAGSAGGVPTAGTGLASSITGSSITRALGGTGGTSSSGNGSAGSSNTGNGGGGSQGGSSQVGRNGGSGVVILRYKYQ